MSRSKADKVERSKYRRGRTDAYPFNMILSWPLDANVLQILTIIIKLIIIIRRIIK